MMMQQRQQPSQPWIFLNELKENYVVRDIPLTTDKIDDDISVLVVVHPQGITDGAQFAIDQFLLRGGKMVALLDPYSFVEAQTAGQYGGAAGYDSTLSKLLPAWGIDFSAKKMIADPAFATQVQRENDVQSDPTILSVTSEGINKEDALGAAVSDLLMPFAGAFTGKPAEGLKEDVLVKSSNQAGLVDVSLDAGGTRRHPQRVEERQYGLSDCDTIERKIQNRLSGRQTGELKAPPNPLPAQRLRQRLLPRRHQSGTSEGRQIRRGSHPGGRFRFRLRCHRRTSATGLDPDGLCPVQR